MRNLTQISATSKGDSDLWTKRCPKFAVPQLAHLFKCCLPCFHVQMAELTSSEDIAGPVKPTIPSVFYSEIPTWKILEPKESQDPQLKAIISFITFFSKNSVFKS